MIYHSGLKRWDGDQMSDRMRRTFPPTGRPYTGQAVDREILRQILDAVEELIEINARINVKLGEVLRELQGGEK